MQVLALIHFFRRRPEWYWFYVILFFGALGSAVYIVAEVVPDFGLARQSFQRFSRGSRVATVEATVRQNPSVANLEELGELYWDQRQYAKAREIFDRAISTKADSSGMVKSFGRVTFKSSTSSKSQAVLRRRP